MNKSLINLSNWCILVYMSSYSDERTEYSIDLTINGIRINTVIISQHYLESHSDSITDAIILKLVEMLDGESFRPDDVDGEFKYFKNFLEYKNKRYKLIWTLEDNYFYVGVVNAHRSEQKGD